MLARLQKLSAFFDHYGAHETPSFFMLPQLIQGILAVSHNLNNLLYIIAGMRYCIFLRIMPGYNRHANK